MKDSAEIQFNDGTTDVRLVWGAFDGDDCFNDFHIDVASNSGTQRFTFGPAAVHSLRKMSRFFRDDSQTSVSLGFQQPDIRYCDISRADGDYRLVVRFEGSGVSEQHLVRQPSIQFGDEFLAGY